LNNNLWVTPDAAQIINDITKEELEKLETQQKEMIKRYLNEILDSLLNKSSDFSSLVKQKLNLFQSNESEL
jgi:ABC-type Zn2+ transport system substrate-binding protein/surface adhesin